MEWMECEREEDSGIVDGVDGVCVCVRDIGSVLVSMVSGRSRFSFEEDGIPKFSLSSNLKTFL